jgi:diaminohydroxyphosphoribosylaminopyrimidine deaminase/5-amino-6-(5-phosphoribosylamino)uracil reductase
MPKPPDERDRGFMALALRLAERGLGRTWPNPAVGCVVVKAGRVVGRGWTQPGGRPHAETEALKRAGVAALGATAYVTLEPCAHYGRTPPCTMALIQAGVRRVVAATLCPDKRVDGQGIAQLRQAGVEVELGLMQAEAEALNAGFFLKERARRPLVTLKLATSLDGRIATRTGTSQWLTGEQARTRGHWLRATHDAIMIGSGTALADDPALTCRLPGLEERSPVRVVLDRRLRLRTGSRLAATARDVPTWVLTGAPVDPEQAQPLRAQGLELIELSASDRDGPDLAAALAALAGRGITRLLVEGGARLATALLRASLVDRLAWFQAPLLIGGDGFAAIGELERDSIAEAVRLARAHTETLADDTLHAYIVLSEGGPCSPASSPTSAGSSRSPRTLPAAAPDRTGGG